MARKIKSVASETPGAEPPISVPEFKEEPDDFDFVERDDEDETDSGQSINYLEMPSGRAIVVELIDDQTGQIYLAAAKCTSPKGLFDPEEGRMVALSKALAQQKADK